MLRRAPERTADERRDALEEANRVRFARAATKRDLKSGRLGIYDLLMDPSEELRGAKVEEMLLAVKGMGRIKVTRVMRDAGVNRSKTLVGLTHGQRDRLIRALGARKADRRLRTLRSGEVHVDKGLSSGCARVGLFRVGDDQGAASRRSRWM